MSAEKNGAVKEQERTAYMLAAREKRLQQLQAELAGYEEALKTAKAWLALLAGALLEVPAARAAICCQSTDGARVLSVERSAVREYLGGAQIAVSADGESYRLTLPCEREG